MAVRSFAVTPRAGGLRVRLGWARGSGSVRWRVKLSARAGGRTLTKTVRGAGFAGTRTVTRTVPLSSSWRGKRVSAALARRERRERLQPDPHRRPPGRAQVRRLVALAAAAVLAAAGAAHASAAPSASLPVPSGPVEWVVGADDREAARDLERALAAAGASVERIPRLDALAVTGGDRDAVRDALADQGGVDYVERTLSRSLHGEPADAVDPATGRAFGWAWDAVRAAEGIAAAGGGAPSSPVGVVDTGVDRDHPDLAGRVLGGHDVLGSGSVTDVVGHGTFIAGLVSAIDGNGAGGRGVAGATPIIPVRVSAGTAITSADLAAGIVAAVNRGARVVNLSFGGPGMTGVEQAALDYARGRDVLVVASAGNSALEGNPVEYPAAAIGGEAGGWSAGLSVAATDPLGRPAPFSTHNSNVSIAAPGAGMGGCAEGVYSTIPSALPPSGRAAPATPSSPAVLTAPGATPTARARASRRRWSRGPRRSCARWRRPCAPIRWATCCVAARCRPSAADGTRTPEPASSTSPGPSPWPLATTPARQR